MYARDTALIATPIGMVRITGMKNVSESIAIVDGTESDVPRADGAVREVAGQLRAFYPADNGRATKSWLLDVERRRSGRTI